MFGVCFKVLYHVVLFLSGKAEKRKNIIILNIVIIIFFNFNAMAPAWAHAEIVLSSGLGQFIFLLRK